MLITVKENTEGNRCLIILMILAWDFYFFFLGLVCVICALSHSVTSNSLRPPWTVACQAPLFMGILQARMLE